MQSEHPTSEELSALLDGELPPAEAAAARAHIETCGQCQVELDQLRTTVAMLRALPAAAHPRSFHVSEQPSRGRLLPFPLPRLTSPVALRALAGVAAALMVVLFVADAPRTDAPRAGTDVAALRAAPVPPAASEAQPDQAATRQVPRALAPQRAPSSAGGAAAGASSPADSVEALPSGDSTQAAQPAAGFSAPAETSGDRAVGAAVQGPQSEPRNSAPAAPVGLPPTRVVALAMALLAVGALVVSFLVRRPA